MSNTLFKQIVNHSSRKSLQVQRATTYACWVPGCCTVANALVIQLPLQRVISISDHFYVDPTGLVNLMSCCFVSCVFASRVTSNKLIRITRTLLPTIPEGHSGNVLGIRFQRLGELIHLEQRDFGGEC